MTKKISLEKQKWLLQESQGWVESDIISSQQHQAINDLYQAELEESESTNWATNILVALGALLIGGGITLLFAHNWEHLGKGARTVLSFLPLVLSQALCIYTFKAKFSSIAWREAGATLVFMAIAASIGLIGQTYHIYGDLERFVFTWFLLGLPLMYLMRSSMVMILLTILICWLCTFQGKVYWLLFLLILPYWIYSYRKQRNMAFYWALWLAAVGFAVALMISSAYRYSLLTLYSLPFLITMASAYYLLGKLLFGFENYKFWKNPLTSLGAIGVGIFSLILSFPEASVSYNRSYHEKYTLNFPAYLDLAIFFLALTFIIFGLIRYRKQLELYQTFILAMGLTGLLALLDFADIISLESWLGWLFNLIIIVTSGAIIFRSAEQGRTLALNGGLLWLSTLILLRFFDSDMSILWKALAFILIGSSFIGINVWFSRKQKQLAKTEASNG